VSRLRGIMKHVCDVCGTPFQNGCPTSYRCSTKCRFNAITKDVEKGDGCWIWPGTKIRCGYGTFRIDRNKRAGLVHRISWEYHHGMKVPTGMWVLHRCDNRSCFNPSHLFLGTVKDNAADMIAKGREARGEQNGKSKLTDARVRVIRQCIKRGMSHRRIAKFFGVGYRTIGNAAQRVSWTHI